MNTKRNNRQVFVMSVLGTIPVVWLALIAAPAKNEGLPGILARVYRMMAEGEYRVTWCQDSLTTVLFFWLLYGVVVGAVFSARHNYRRLEEYGSAKWGNKWMINQRYADKHYEQNRLLTMNVRMGLDGRKHRRNLNTLVCGDNSIIGLSQMTFRKKRVAKT